MQVEHLSETKRLIEQCEYGRQESNRYTGIGVGKSGNQVSLTSHGIDKASVVCRLRKKLVSEDLDAMLWTKLDHCDLARPEPNLYLTVILLFA